MIDVQKRLGVKDMSDLVREEIHSIFTTKNPKKEQIRKKKGLEKNNLIIFFIFMFEVTLCQE